MSACVRLRSFPALAGAGLLLLVAGCQESGPVSPDGLTPGLHISHGGTNWGNPEFFFAPPLAPSTSPTGTPNERLRPFVRICVTDGDDGGSSTDAEWPDVEWTGCVTDVTLDATGFAEGLLMENKGGGEYQANWNTSPLLELLDDQGELQSFRIEVWGLPLADADGMEGPARLDLIGDPRWLFGWRDVTQSPSVASCNQDPAGDICRINYGQNIPVKVWIGQSVFCPESGDCAVQFVDPTQAANLTADLENILGAGFFGHLVIPSGASTDGFALAFEPCTESEQATVEGTVDIPTFDPCLRTVTPPDLPLLNEDTPAVISVCTHPDTPPAGVKDGQQVQLALHHFSTRESSDGSITSVEAWPHAENCDEDATSGPGVVAFAAESEGSSLFRFARAVGERVLAWTNLQPRPLVARAPAARWDVGLGGSGRDLKSFWMFALPGAFDGDASQTVAPDGQGEGEIEVLVLDLDGVAVENADVTFYETDANFENPVLLGTVTTDFDGLASIRVPVEVGEEYYFVAEGNGIAGPGPDPCLLVGTFGTVDGVTGSCSGPRADADPFQPLSTGHHFNDAVDGPPVTLARGFFRITAVACHTPVMDGILSSQEWDCASEETIQVNLSGGSTVPGRLLWMNDDDNFYVAVEVPGTDRRNSLRIEWHRNDEAPASAVDANGFFTGTRALGSDVWEFHPEESSPTRDMFVDSQCSGSSQSSCGQLDSDYVAGGAGGNDVLGGFNNAGPTTVYELAHPLSTTDVCNGTKNGSRGCLGPPNPYTGPIDLVAGSGDVRGFFLSLRMGSGAQGNTVWPGFLQYLAVELR